MAQTITCDTCRKTVYITDKQDGVDFDKKYKLWSYTED